MLEAGDCIDVSQRGSWDIDVNVNQGGLGAWDVSPSFASLPGKKPYLINLFQVECVVGEWNKDKTQYGVRIFYTSGNSVWVGEDAAKSLFKKMDNGTHGDAESLFNQAKREG